LVSLCARSRLRKQLRKVPRLAGRQHDADLLNVPGLVDVLQLGEHKRRTAADVGCVVVAGVGHSVVVSQWSASL
jgi:hypothetical protein